MSGGTDIGGTVSSASGPGNGSTSAGGVAWEAGSNNNNRKQQESSSPAPSNCEYYHDYLY